MIKYYHGTTKNLKSKFIVKTRVSKSALQTMDWDYSIRDLKGGIFVSDVISCAETYGPKIYEITLKETPVMINWGIYFIKNGTKVNAKRII